MFSLPHLIRRVSRQRLVSASVMLGIALAVALGVAVPLATAALASMGLRATVEALPRSSQNIQLTRRVEPFDAAFQQRLQRRLGDLIGYSYTVSYTPILDARRETPVLAAPVRLRTQGGLIEHSVVTGRVPRPRPSHLLPPSEQGCNEASPVEVLVSAEQLAANSLAVGDQLCIGSILPAIITGSFVPRNLEEDYWFGDARPVRGEIDPTPPDQLIVVLMLAEEDFASVAPVFGGEPGTHIYRALVRTAAINLDTLDDVDSRLRTFRTDANTLQPRPIVLTGLDRAIATFHTRFQLLQSALAALLLGLLTLAIVYVVFVGALATERQSNEIALLRSRGGSSRQILQAQVGQSLVLAVPGVALGLGVGALAVLWMSRTALFQRLRGVAAFELRFTPATALIPGAILLVALLGLALAARPALAQSQVTLRQERARPPRRLGWGRLQIDVLLVFFAALGLWQLRRYGGGLTTTLDGMLQFNLLLLATPIILLVAGSLLFLRLFALGARALGWTLSQRRGLVPALGAWQLARNPLLYGRLVLLLTLTIGLGVYSQVVTRTIGRTQLRQALDEAGADVRVPLPPGDDPAAVVATYPAAAHTVLSRVDADVLHNSQGAEQQQGTLALIGVDGSALSTVLALSGSDDATLLGGLRLLGAGTAPPLGLSLPPGTQALQVQLKGDVRGVTVYARFAGLNGERQVALGQPAADWQTFQAAIPRDLQPPVTLQSLIAAPDPRSPQASGERLVVDQLFARTDGVEVALHGFEQIDDWEALGPAAGDAGLSSDRGAAPGRMGAQLSFRRLALGRWAALRFRVAAPLPVYTSQEAGGVPASPGQRLRLRIGDQRFDAVVQQRIGRLLGIDSEQTVLLAHRTRLAALLTYGIPGSLPPTELRLALQPGASVKAGPTVTTKAAALLLLAADPLGNGVSVILLLGFGCALLLSLIGFLTYAALTIQARQLDWAVLGALGLSPRQILLVIAAEQGFVLGGSILAGMAVGLLLAATTRPFLQVVTRNILDTPAVIDWRGLVPIVVGLILALALALVLLLLNVQRRGMIRVLRLGEG